MVMGTTWFGDTQEGVEVGGVLGLILQNLLPGIKGWVKPDFHPDLQKGDFTLSFPACTPLQKATNLFTLTLCRDNKGSLGW